MVGNPVVLRPVCANFVSPFAAASLFRALQVACRLRLAVAHLAQSGLKRVERLPPVGVLVSPVNLDADPRGFVGQHHARIGFVAVLPARPGVARESHLHFVALKRHVLRRIRLHGNNRHGRGVHPAFALTRRYALPPVASAFGAQQIDRRRGPLDD